MTESTIKLSTQVAAQTHVGNVRENNEDYVFAIPTCLLVADGMGGHSGGEVASEVVVETVKELYTITPPRNNQEAPLWLADAFELARLSLVEEGETLGQNGMGTALVAALLIDNQVHIGQQGDSRAYLYREGTLEQIGYDHNVPGDLFRAGEITAEEAFDHWEGNVITRHLSASTRHKYETELHTIEVKPGDIVLLCSDGLSGYVKDEPLSAQLAAYSGDPQLTCDQLIELALNAGGRDNVTVALMCFS